MMIMIIKFQNFFNLKLIQIKITQLKMLIYAIILVKFYNGKNYYKSKLRQNKMQLFNNLQN